MALSIKERDFIHTAKFSGESTVQIVVVRKLAGRNSHHIVEGAFKAMGRALREAWSIDRDFRDEIPSTKGVL